MAKDLPETDAQTLLTAFETVRRRSLRWAEGLSAEDLCIQTMADVSPGKWHLAHTTWFWETFLLKEAAAGYASFDPRFNYLFNSYYEAVGERHARPERGFLSRPSLDEVLAYRAHVDEAVRGWFESAAANAHGALEMVIRTGLAHEEQHQELFLTDIKHVLSCNAFPQAAYMRDEALSGPLEPVWKEPDWIAFEGELHEFGHAGAGFAFDNEGPHHKAWLAPFALAARPVTNAEYLVFMEDGGYERAEFWLAEGWTAVCEEGRRAPYYWRQSEGGWSEFTLHGLRRLDPDAPVSHLDYYEASAFAVWSGYRLPEEREWEHAAHQCDPANGRWAAPDGLLHPQKLQDGSGLQAMYGEVWEWTRSAYSPYPGYRAPAGAIGEYNGKFMCGQFVLRGGSALTPPGHVRATYRNFFPPDARWQMSGLRLARDV